MAKGNMSLESGTQRSAGPPQKNKKKEKKKNGVPLQTAPRRALGLTNTSAESTRSSRALSLTKSI